MEGEGEKKGIKENYGLSFDTEEDRKRSYTIIFWDLFPSFPYKFLIILFLIFSGLFFWFSIVYSEGVGFLIDIMFRIFLILTAFLFVDKNRYATLNRSPNYSQYIKNVVESIGFNVQDKLKTRRTFLIVLGIAFNIRFLIYWMWINNSILNFLSYFVLIFIPGIIIWHIKNDKGVILLKDDYFLNVKYFFKIRYDQKIFRKKNTRITDICVALISNKLCSKKDDEGRRILEKIAEQHWLQKKIPDKLIPSEKNLYLYGYTSISTFKNQLLNFIKAIKEWDERNR